jgi:hypothetical protein
MREYASRRGLRRRVRRAPALFIRSLRINGPVGDPFAPIRRIGGPTGWYHANWFWQLRGLLDTATGGVALRRGRRDPYDLRVGDTVDFWRVEQLEPGRLLRLRAEMKTPGRLWLQFEVVRERDGAQVRQTTIFDAHGCLGLAYRYALYPLHRRVFGHARRDRARDSRRRRQRLLAQRPPRPCYVGGAAFTKTPREAKARLFRVPRPERQGPWPRIVLGAFHRQPLTRRRRSAHSRPSPLAPDGCKRPVGSRTRPIDDH